MHIIEERANIFRTQKDYSKKEIAKHYEKLANFGLWQSEKYVFEKFVAKDASVLDVGCGTGRTTFGLFDLGYKNILGVDITKKYVKIAKRIAKKDGKQIPFEVGNVLALAFEDETFNAVLFSYNGLMTIPGAQNRKRAVSEIARVLKPNGVFVFTTHDREKDDRHLDFWKEEKLRWENGEQDQKLVEFGDKIVEHAGDEVFLHFPTYKEVCALVESVGFEVAYSKMRWDVCATPEKERETFGECRFFVARKKG